MAVFNSEPIHVRYLSAEQFTLTGGTLGDSAIATNAGIDDAKLKHRYQFELSQTGTVVAETRYLRIVQATGVILAVEAAITETIATGADRTVTVDLQKSTGAGAFATVLSAVITFNNASVLRTVSVATISSSALADGDILKLVIAVAGAAGNQALGLLASVTIRENAL